MMKQKSPIPADLRLRDAIIRSDFASYIRKVFQTLSPSAASCDNWDSHAIAHQLERIRGGEIRRLISTVPPHSMKSVICAVAFPSFIFGHDATKRIIGVSYSSDLSIKFSNDCREVMNSPWYRQLFPDTKISRAKNTESEFITTRGGFRISTSVDGTLTGRGGDIVIVDDPLKPIDALSDSKRERVNLWFANTILSRLDDKRTGAIIVVMQRLHQDDLVGSLVRESGEWTVVSLPAIADEETEFQIGEDRFHRRRVGDVLHAEREPLSILESYRAQMGTDVFQAQYLQCPVPRGGVMIKSSWLRRYDRLPIIDSSTTTIQSWDTATRDNEHASYSVCTTWRYHDRRYYLVDVFRDRLDYLPLKAKALSLARLQNPKVILIEDAGVGTAMAKELQAAGLPIRAVRPILGKRTRMSIQAAKFESGQVFLPKEASWLQAFETELFSFPNCRHDDQIDSVAQALGYEIATTGLFTD